MHQPIRDGLEDYLKGGERRMPLEFDAHLAQCHACAEQLRAVDAQAQLLRGTFRATEAEPGPGFYGRVMERIESQGQPSIWSVFLEPRFGKRLVFASATLVLLLGTYLASTEAGEHGYTQQPSTISQDASQQDRPQHDRDAVLVNLASYHE
jgi:anti-sigma factor RsiW